MDCCQRLNASRLLTSVFVETTPQMFCFAEPKGINILQLIIKYTVVGSIQSCLDGISVSWPIVEGRDVVYTVQYSTVQYNTIQCRVEDRDHKTCKTWIFIF
jgi:hypothetical protein